ncbi:single-stranded DNA-binding protein [bacterium]|nr:MAG: single-stranded DNA-binding protein [bacterium]
MNQIVIVGRLTRDPEARTTQNGKTFATFAVAVNKRIKPTNPDERDADFFNVKVWNQTADYVTSYLGKGRLVSVSGRMESRKYVDKEGVNREIWEINADQVNGLDRPKDDGDSAPSGGNYDRPAARPAAPRAATAAPAEDEYDPFADNQSLQRKNRKGLGPHGPNPFLFPDFSLFHSRRRS